MFPLKPLLVLVVLFAAGSADFSRIVECQKECLKAKTAQELKDCSRECFKKIALDNAGSDRQKSEGLDKWLGDLDSILQRFPKEEAEKRISQFLNDPQVKQTVDELRKEVKDIPWKEIAADAVKEIQKSNAPGMINFITVGVALIFSANVF
ncbi:hypothetical protein ANCCAN_11204 [Ancylostoma caninum]|uniref:Uncharacterized protein n=1 Tax=Ancylostoma caninum TaxID=29170 RepID=A0A368GEK4_ANCCA|nr:hypothetical protein ANCCAN_11204 [Ancylostoma caninum]